MNTAVIGNTGHLNYLFEDLPKLPECNVVAACAAGGEQPSRTLSALQKLNLPASELFADYRTMLDQVKVDLVVIGGPFEERAAMCKYCMERNIAVFTEKPCAVTLEELAELKLVAAKHNGVLYGMMGIRFEAPFHTAF
ncbi:MAG: Gfo/Idh/MocA family oxidoreductase [Lentisphaeria bacterium]|nr:Gfo/Idh/MocA family oxidoreductase [Lentisphaeria bacterium]